MQNMFPNIKPDFSKAKTIRAKKRHQNSRPFSPERFEIEVDYEKEWRKKHPFKWFFRTIKKFTLPEPAR